MATDGAGLSDDVAAELNPADALEPVDQPPALERPAEGASKAKWVDYAVSLGAARESVTGESRHWDDAAQEYLQAKALSKDELIELADRLGG